MNWTLATTVPGANHPEKPRQTSSAGAPSLSMCSGRVWAGQGLEESSRQTMQRVFPGPAVPCDISRAAQPLERGLGPADGAEVPKRQARS